jgi:hypothetical protein
LVACAAERGGEVVCAVAGAVVGDDPVDVGDAVGGEKRPCPVEESDRGGRGFVGQGFGVGQAGVSVHGGM